MNHEIYKLVHNIFVAIDEDTPMDNKFNDVYEVTLSDNV
jgi:hypothetical protein